MSTSTQMPDNFEVPLELQLVKADGTVISPVPSGYSFSITSNDPAVATFVEVEGPSKGKAVAVGAGAVSFVGSVTYPDGSVKTDQFDLTVTLTDAGVPQFLVGTPVQKS